MLLSENLLKKRLLLTPALMLVLASCSKQEAEEEQIIPEKEYAIQDIQYFMSGQDRVDTLTLSLQDTTIHNPGNSLATSTFAADFSGLEKTSQFEISNNNALPADLNFEQFEVSIPVELQQNSTIVKSAFKVPFSTGVTRIANQSFSADTLTFKIPAKSRIQVDRSIQAQNITCSFNAVISEKTTGQTYPIQGSWKGILRFDNLTTKLTEHPL